MKKFEQHAARSGNPNWEKLISRQKPIYNRPDEIRSEFARDYTRVLHSLAFRRLKHKAQVFFNGADNDHICTRIEHVYHVDSVSSTIAIALGLNEELTRAISIAHDLGHAPYGHEGEKILRAIRMRELGKSFWHEQNGLRFVDYVELLEDNERNPQNLNLTYAVRDGIISHCGELDKNCIRPRNELIDLENFEKPGQFEAATWEGCVVKLADKIAYLGRDIEDATRLGYLAREQMAQLEEMARTNDAKAINTTVIMHNMIIDLCKNSNPEEGLKLSDEMSDQLNEIKKFNYANIYKNPRLEPYRRYAEIVLNELYDDLSSYYQGPETAAHLKERCFAGSGSAGVPGREYVKEFTVWLEERSTDGPHINKIYDLAKADDYKQAVIDYLAGMTDSYANKCYNELLEC